MSKYVPPSRRAGYVPSSAALPPGHRPSRPDARPFASVDKITPYSGTLNFFRHAPRPAPAGVGPADAADAAPTDDARVAAAPTADATDGAPTDAPPLARMPPRPAEPPHPHAGVLAYLVLWEHAHPRWATGEVWCHTDADRLIAEHAAGTAGAAAGAPGRPRNLGRPVPVFEGAKRGSQTVAFVGWWVVEEVVVVEPHSDELKEMLEQKEQARAFQRAGRTRAAWAESLRQTWVKLRLARVGPGHARHAELASPLDMADAAGLVLDLAGAGAGAEVRAGEAPAAGVGA